MTNYARAAILAVEICQESATPDPVAAWETAVARFIPKISGRLKSCPRCTFLGLCDAGLIKGIAAGAYLGRRNKNARYAVTAVELLRENPAVARDTVAMWRMVMAGEAKKANGQMEIVGALWSAGMIERRAEEPADDANAKMPGL